MSETLDFARRFGGVSRLYGAEGLLQLQAALLSLAASRHRYANRLIILGNRQLNDFDNDVADARVVGKKRVHDMIGNRFDQREVHTLRQFCRGLFQRHIVFGRRQRCVRHIMWCHIQRRADRYAQRLRQMRFLAVNAGEDMND